MGNLMKAAVFHGVRDVRIEEVPKPTAGTGEVVLRVLRCSVCGTDKRIYTHGQKNVVPPAITGHEIVGTVHEIGAGVERGLRTGQKLSWRRSWAAESVFTASANNTISATHLQRWAMTMPGDLPNTSRFRPAAVAQGNVIPIPNSMSVERAALVEPLSCVLNGQEYLSPQPGDRAVVFGVGPIGLMHASILKARGCDPVIVADVSQERLDYVRSSGSA